MEKDELVYNAISLDNNILMSLGYKFDEGFLSQLSQFKQSSVRFVISDIVHFEAINHIGKNISSARSDISGALRSARWQLKICDEHIEAARELLDIEGRQEDIADQRLRKFYDDLGGYIVDSSEYAAIGDVVRGYFQVNPPFEARKKNEFPDAIALSGLERWAENNNYNIVVVTNDSGWKSYVEQSPRMKCFSDLGDALAYLQPHAMVNKIINWVRGNSLLGEDAPVINEIFTAIANSVNNSCFHAQGSSHMSYETNDEQAMYLSHEFVKDEQGVIAIDVVRLSDNEVVLKTGAYVLYQAEAGFDFIVHDRVDNDYMSLGGTIAETEDEYHTDILITLSGDLSKEIEHFDSEDLKVVKVEVVETLTVVDFGEVEPDWHADLYHI